MEMASWEHGNLRNEGNEMDLDEGVETSPSTRYPGGGPRIPPEAIPAPDSPSSAAQAPSSSRCSAQHLVPESSFDRNCEQSQAPRVDRTQ